MAGKNVTQLTPQPGPAADPTTLLYTVTGGSVDRGLPLSIFVNSLGLTGVPTTPSAAASTNTTQIASCAFTQSAISSFVVGVYAPLASPALTGTPTTTNPSTADNSTRIASTTYVQNNLANYLTTTSASSIYAPKASPALTGTPTAPTAAVSTNTTQIATTAFVNGQFAVPPALGSTTPNSAAVTSLIALAAITPSQTAGIVGTTTNNSANAGSVGEYVTATTLTVSTSSGVPLNVTSISLTAGDWDVSGVLQVIPTGSTTLAGVTASISTTSGATGPFGTSTFLNLVATTGYATGQSQGIPTPVVRLSLASTTTVFLVANVVFGTSTLTSSGLIRARRMR